MMGWSPGCYIPSFVEIGKPVSEKIFDVFLPYRGVGGPSWSCDQHRFIRFSFP